MFISVDNDNATFTYCYYEDVVTIPNICCDVTLRYVDDVMDLFSMLTRILDGQSLEISPNRWHSLCTPPVFRKTRPNDLAI